MPASDQRIAANRANAKRSTGPRTPGGKERSKVNAVVHGLRAQTSLLPGEDAEQLEALSNSLIGQLKPRGAVQWLMAERVISLAWKLRRVARAEEAAAREMEQDEMDEWKERRDLNLRFGGPILSESPKPTPRDGGALLSASIPRGSGHEGRLVRLTHYELKLDAALRAGMRELLKLQKEAGAFEEVEEEAHPPRVAIPDPEAIEPAPPADERPMDADGVVGGAGRTLPGTNEPNAIALGVGKRGEEDPGLRCAAPAACGEVPVEQTNPLPGSSEPARDAEAPGVTAGRGAESSAPVPGTSSSPPPGPRR